MRNHKIPFGWAHRRKQMLRVCVASALLIGSPGIQVLGADPDTLTNSIARSNGELGILRAIGIRAARYPSSTQPTSMTAPRVVIEQLPSIETHAGTTLSDSEMIIPVGYNEPVAVASEATVDRIVMHVRPQANKREFSGASDRSDPVSISTSTSRRVSVRLSDSNRLSDSKSESPVVAVAFPSAISGSQLLQSEPAPDRSMIQMRMDAPTFVAESNSLSEQDGNQPSDSDRRETGIVRIKPTALAATTETASSSPSDESRYNNFSSASRDSIEPSSMVKMTLGSVQGENNGVSSQVVLLPASMSQLASQTYPTINGGSSTSLAITPSKIINQPVANYTVKSVQPLLDFATSATSKFENTTDFPTNVKTSSVLQVSHLSGQAVHMPSPFTQVLVEDERICKVIPTGDRDFSIMGSNIGMTRIAIWTTNQGNAEASTIQVEVQKPWQGPIVDSSDDLRTLSTAIANMHPNSIVELSTAKDGSLVIRGEADSQAAAKQILSLVRKLCLVPVRDHLKVKSR